MHGFLVAGSGELDHDADAAAHVDVGIHGALDADEAADGDLLADAGHSGGNGMLHSVAVHGGGHEGVHVGGVGVGDLLGDPLHESQELVGLGHEVGLAVDLDQHGHVAVPVIGHNALSGDTAGLLGGSRQALLTQEVDGLLHVAFAGHEGLLAIHHAGARALTEGRYVFGCDRCHILNPPWNYSSVSSLSSAAASVICSPCLPSRTASAILEVMRRTARMASSLAGMG